MESMEFYDFEINSHVCNTIGCAGTGLGYWRHYLPSLGRFKTHEERARVDDTDGQSGCWFDLQILILPASTSVHNYIYRTTNYLPRAFLMSYDACLHVQYYANNIVVHCYLSIGALQQYGVRAHHRFISSFESQNINAKKKKPGVLYTVTRHRRRRHAKYAPRARQRL